MNITAEVSFSGHRHSRNCPARSLPVMCLIQLLVVYVRLKRVILVPSEKDDFFFLCFPGFLLLYGALDNCDEISLSLALPLPHRSGGLVCTVLQSADS